MLRQIILDTETTGLDPSKGHRIIEIACLEMINRQLTNQYYHCYLNPEREVEKGSFNVHGLTQAFLADKPKFEEIHEDFLAYIQGAELIIHNARFDVGFINHELKLIDAKIQVIDNHCSVIDTLAMARRKHPGQRNTLDALCKRYNVDNSARTLHGALIDCQLLAQVYLYMTGGQKKLFNEELDVTQTVIFKKLQTSKIDHKLPVELANPDECAEHEAFLRHLKDVSGYHLWSAEDKDSDA